MAPLAGSPGGRPYARAVDHEPTAADPSRDPRRNAPLTGRERLAAAGLALACVVGSGVMAAILGVITGRGMVDVVWSAVVYGGLLASAAVVVYVDRAYARQCPRCRARTSRDDARCPSCGYDVVERPRYACSEGHGPHLEGGVCPCGRRLQPVDRPRGVRPQVVASLGLGAAILLLLVLVWGALSLLS